jgi:hypothetical protein
MVRWPRWSRVCAVDQSGPKITFGHSEALLDLPELVVGRHVFSGWGFQVGDVAL